MTVEIDPIVPGEAGATAESEDEKRRRLWRDKKRQQRAQEKQQKSAQSTETESEWWARNRALLQPKELEAMLAQQDRIQDVMDEIELTNHPEFPEFTVETVTARVVASVKEYGVAHLGAINRDEIPSNWPERMYWREPALLALLEQEGPQTAQYIRYGLLAALSDWRVYRFLSDVAKWPFKKVAELLGYHVDHDNRVRYR